MVERISSGVVWLDETIQSGFPKSKTVVVEGGTGSGKTVMGFQFLKEGLHSDEHVAYITANDSPSEVLESLSELNWDLSWAIDQDRLKIVDIRNYFSALIDPENFNSMMQSLFDELLRLTERYSFTRIVFDPVILPSIRGVDDYSHNYFKSLCEYLEETISVTSLLISNNLDPAWYEYASGVICLDSSSSSQELVVKKMKYTSVERKTYPFEIVPVEGLRIIT